MLQVQLCYLSVFLFLFFAAGFMRDRFFMFFMQAFTEYMLIETLTIEIR